MNKKATFILLLVLGISEIAHAYENTYAVIVGVADYKNFASQDGDLRFTVSDAVSFCEFLKSAKGGSVPAANICLLTDSLATKENIVTKAKELFSKAKKNDRAIFFFSGHGNKGCFLPYDAGDIGNCLLYFNEIKSIFRSAHCNTKLLFADACFSGGMKNTLEAQEKAIRIDMEKGIKDASDMNIAVMMSCQGDETSVELGNFGQGLFTYYLMKGLEGLSNIDDNKYVTIYELFKYVHDNVIDMAGKIGKSQTPILFGKFNLQLIVAEL